MQKNEDYIAALDEYDLTEADVGPIVAENRRTATHKAILRLLASDMAVKEFERRAPGVLEQLIDCLKHNANVLAGKLNTEFLLKISNLGICVPKNAQVGIFPTRHFNALATHSPNGYLILLDDGLFEIIEAAVTLMLAESLPTESARQLSRIIEQYCTKHTLPDPKVYEDGQNFGKYVISTAIVNFAEEFVIAHEYGHLARGHLDKGARAAIQAQDGPLRVISKAITEEHEADHWALHVIAHNHPHETENELVRMACMAGPFVFLGIAALIEGFLARARPESAMRRDASHPPAVERLVRAWLYFGMMDISNQLDLGKRFLELTDNCHRILFGEPLKIDTELMSRVAMNLPFRLSTDAEKLLNGGHAEAEFNLLNLFITRAYKDCMLLPATGIASTRNGGPASGVPGLGVFQSAPGEDNLLDLFEETCNGLDVRP